MNRLIGLCILLVLVGCRPAADGTELYRTGEKAFASGQFVLAEQSYEQLLQQYPEASLRWEAWNRLLLIAEQVRQDPKRAMEILQSMSLEYESEPARVVDILQRMATMYRDGLSQPEKAVDVWQRSLEFCDHVQGACRQARWDMAETYLGWGRYAEARQELLECLELSEQQDGRALVMYTMARAYALASEWDEALSWLEQVQGLGEGAGDVGPLAAFMAADIHVQEGRLDRARELLTSIMASHPNPQLVQLRLEQIESTRARVAGGS